MTSINSIIRVAANFKLSEGLAAETSGGLFISLSEKDSINFEIDMKKANQDFW